MSKLQPSSNFETVKARSAAPPALDPFEKMYGPLELAVVEQNLTPPPHPKMLDGIWKKQPQRNLKMICREHISRLVSSTKIAVRTVVDRIRHPE